jgi:PKHD-type hydroxylase
MNLKNIYWMFESALSKEFCNDLIKLADSKEKKEALIGNFSKKEKITKSDLKEIHKKRNSQVTWLNDKWIYNQIIPFIHKANENAGWNFQFDWSESCQFTRYKLKQFYDWHVDSYNEPYHNPMDLNFHGKIRKLSVTCQLSEPEDYKGGELEFHYINEDPKKKEILKFNKPIPKGSIIVFPSFVPHRVSPVTKGKRYSLVIWSLGYPFK